MAVPKRRTSKSRKRKRRTHYKIDPPTITECSHCNEPKLPHHICMNCGYYKGRQVLEIKKK